MGSLFCFFDKYILSGKQCNRLNIVVSNKNYKHWQCYNISKVLGKTQNF